jgi:glutamate-1-semialdehyde 2,1-aminomutase
MLNEDRYRKSRELLERARGSLAGGVSSPFRAMFPVPLYFEDGFGARLTDVDGNSYIDYTLAWGPNILGYRHPRMVEAMTRAASGVHTYGAQHELEPEVAEKLCAIVPCAERVAFTSSGTEAVQAALRLARGFTGRNLILKFEGHYHGWVDSVLLSYRGEGLGSRGQVPNALDNVVIAPWNSPEHVERAFAERGAEIAAVITEPVLCNSGCLMPRPGFHQFLREITQRFGALLIFDEVITGFRMAPGGAQQHFGIKPDLATFGKALAAGLPMSAIAGRKDILDEMQKGVVFGGTFNGNPMVLAAANAALDVLSADGGAALERANRLGTHLMEGFRRIAAAKGVPVHVTGFGTAFGVHFTSAPELHQYRDTFASDKERLTRYVRRMLDEGIYLLPDGRAYTSCAHNERDVEETLDAVERVLS